MPSAVPATRPDHDGSASAMAGRKHWILDNDSKYGVRTTAVLGSKLLQTSIRAPDMNAYCERFVRSISEDCLDHIVFLSEDHLRTDCAHIRTSAMCLSDPGRSAPA